MATSKKKHAVKRKQKPVARLKKSSGHTVAGDDIETVLSVLVAFREMLLGLIDAVREQHLAINDARALTQVQASNLRSLVQAV